MARLIGSAFGLALHRRDHQIGGLPGPLLFDSPSFSAGLRKYVLGPGVLRPWLARFVRRLALLESAREKSRALACSGGDTFVIRIAGRIDQKAIRNLLLWQDHALTRNPKLNDGRAIDIMLSLSSRLEDEPRLFDLLSTALMLERVRNVSVFWSDQSLEAAVAIFAPESDRDGRPRTEDGEDDLQRIVPEPTGLMGGQASFGGIKLPLDGRKRAEDFCKASLPGQFILAVGLREDQDGFADASDLGMWVSIFDAMAARHPSASFVILNRAVPSQGRMWSSHLRYAQHQGLSVQDAICLAQIADGYVGVLDVFGLVAQASARPGVYVPLMDQDPECDLTDASDEVLSPAQILARSRDWAHIEAVLGRFLASVVVMGDGSQPTPKKPSGF
jgi:hypothetical protein